MLSSPTHHTMLIDCDAFYCSVEQIFNPKLRNRPVVVLSNNDGMVIARSKPAKKLIPMGAPIFQYKDIIHKHNIATLSANFELYGDLSSRVMNILRQFSDHLEVYSIDEAFLTISANQHPSCSIVANEIQQRVKQWTGVPVTCGIGISKTLAKVAVEFAKNHAQYNGVLDLAEIDSIDNLLDQLPVSDIWGIGRRYSELLIKNNILTARQFRDADDTWIRRHLTVVGLRTAWELRGIPCLPLEELPSPKQTIICSRSFGRTINALTDLKEAIATHVERGAEKLRHQKSIADSIQVFVETDRFKTTEPQYSNAITIKLDQPTAYTPELINAAIIGLERIFESNYSYKRGGIMLLGICFEDQVQAGFWGRSYSDRDRHAMQVVDEINKKFGKGTIKLATACLTKDQPWQMRCQNRSPRYTTRWLEIPTVKAI